MSMISVVTSSEVELDDVRSAIFSSSANASE
jgi:hypothetical protein